MMPEFAVIGGGTLQPADRYRFAIDLVAAANRLTGTRARTAEHTWHDIALTIQQVCLIEARL
jgi:hypothetical protein